MQISRSSSYFPCMPGFTRNPGMPFDEKQARTRLFRRDTPGFEETRTSDAFASFISIGSSFKLPADNAAHASLSSRSLVKELRLSPRDHKPKAQDHSSANPQTGLKTVSEPSPQHPQDPSANRRKLSIFTPSNVQAPLQRQPIVQATQSGGAAIYVRQKPLSISDFVIHRKL